MSTLAVSDSHSEMVCTLGKDEFVLANIYVVILLFLALFINSINRNIKRNYKVSCRLLFPFTPHCLKLQETKWLFVSSVLCTLVWLCWIVAYFIVPNDLKVSAVLRHRTISKLQASDATKSGTVFTPYFELQMPWHSALQKGLNGG